MSRLYANQSVVVNQTVQGGVGFLGVLFIVLLVLKLTGLAALSWWFVLAPFWVPVAGWLAFMAGCFIILGILEYSSKPPKK